MDSLVKHVLLIQSALEVLLVILLALVLWRTRSRAESSQEANGEPANPALLPTELKNGIERFLSESEKISKAFETNLQDKKELSQGLILKLDKRLADYQDLLGRTEAAIAAGEKRLAELTRQTPPPPSGDQANPAAPETRALVLRLAKKGLSVEEIALRSKLLRGEVELIINLEKDFSV
ncbi:MAG: DUF2802 domain-containing protein [Deltaproteobacteria bacterium]|nr:DUF2802 domain-containing protein [Deltaproteobacteria bacterium]